MMEPRKVRKGTRSCTECRRRKVRCTWDSDEARICRRCEERGTNCIPQVFAPKQANGDRLTTRGRVTRLEQQVAGLNKIVRNLEKKLGYKASEASSPPIATYDDQDGSETEESDEASSMDGPMSDAPTYLNSLFDNSIIGSANSNIQRDQQNRRQKVQNHLADVARKALQPLIPPREDVALMSERATRWLSLLHALFPAVSVIKTGNEMIAQYDEMKSPSVAPLTLAAWLLSVAMTSLQAPLDDYSPNSPSQWQRAYSKFCRSVCDAYESSIFSKDSLIGSPEGIETSLLLLRLQLGRSNFKRCWLQLRRLIAISELIGLPRAAVGPKAVLWQSICNIDRIASMMFALPSATRRFPSERPELIQSDGTVSPRAYMTRLSEIAYSLEDIGDMQSKNCSPADLYSAMLKADGELRTLASLAAPGWWADRADKPLPDTLVQYWHTYLALRVHMPSILRPGPSTIFGFSRTTCLEYCTTAINMYLSLRPKLPKGFFICQMMDFQVFTATTVMLLGWHTYRDAEQATMRARFETIDIWVSRVLEALDSVLDDPGSNFARQAVVTIRALNELLAKGDQAAGEGHLSLRVPLLGKIHVRRKVQPKEPTQPNHSNNRQDLMVPGGTYIGSASALPDVNFFDQGSSPWGPFSWSVEDDHESLFQDAVMMEDFGQLDFWNAGFVNGLG